MLNLLGKINNGVLEYNADELKAISHKLEGKDVEISIKKLAKGRTLAQNRLYWLYLGLIQDETGNDRNDLHECFKRFLLPAQQITCFGIPIKIPGSTIDLDVNEFSEYLLGIEKLSGIQVPNIWMEEYLQNCD